MNVRIFVSRRIYPGSCIHWSCTLSHAHCSVTASSFSVTFVTSGDFLLPARRRTAIIIYTGCFTKGYRKLNHYKTYIYKNIPMKLSQNVHHINKFFIDGVS